ncbi:MAG: hypothetical protein B6242_05700 [Anaerolineaceae bacterium 4572_78]|nr:MAG: hypothetical protein B6242_05700 [Anaerolineaceae bacterium 4572_78]
MDKMSMLGESKHYSKGGMNMNIRLVLRLFVFVLLLGVIGCSSIPFEIPYITSQQTDAEEVYIRPPVTEPKSFVLTHDHEQLVPIDQELVIISAHEDPTGVVSVSFFVDGNLISEDTPRFPQSYFVVEHRWIPHTPQTYAIEIIATSADTKTKFIPLTFDVVADENVVVIVDEELSSSPPATPTATNSDDYIIMCSNNAVLVEDVNIPDGTEIKPNTLFNKTWRVSNNGTCDWQHGYYLDSISEDGFSGERFTFSESVMMNKETDLTISMTTPTQPGTYRSDWQLFTPEGKPFGNVFFVEFVVPDLCQGQTPKIIQFNAEPATIQLGETSTLSWQIEGGTTSIEISPNVQISGNSVVVSPDKTTIYTLMAKNVECTVSAQVTVEVEQVSTSALDSLTNPPTNLRIIGVTKNHFSLAWDDNSDNETAFQLFNAITNAPVLAFSADSTHGQVVNLLCGTAYQWTLFAENNGVLSAASNITPVVKTLPCDN